MWIQTRDVFVNLDMMNAVKLMKRDDGIVAIVGECDKGDVVIVDGLSEVLARHFAFDLGKTLQRTNDVWQLPVDIGAYAISHCPTSAEAENERHARAAAHCLRLAEEQEAAARRQKFLAENAEQRAAVERHNARQAREKIGRF